MEDDLFILAEKTGRLAGMLGALPEETRMEALIELMVAKAIKPSEIEGECLSRKDVISSIKNNLGINPKTETVKAKAPEGIGELMIDVHNTYKEPISEETLFRWHRMLFKGSIYPKGFSHFLPSFLQHCRCRLARGCSSGLPKLQLQSNDSRVV